MMETIMTNMKFQLDKALPLWGQDRRASRSESSPKKRVSDDRKWGRSKKRKRKHPKKHLRYSSTSSSSASESYSPERKRKKAGKKRRKHHCKKASFSSNESDTETDFETEPFKLIPEADRFKYNLPSKKANYAYEQFHGYWKILTSSSKYRSQTPYLKI